MWEVVYRFDTVHIIPDGIFMIRRQCTVHRWVKVWRVASLVRIIQRLHGCVEGELRALIDFHVPCRLQRPVADLRKVVSEIQIDFAPVLSR